MRLKSQKIIVIIYLTFFFIISVSISISGLPQADKSLFLNYKNECERLDAYYSVISSDKRLLKATEVHDLNNIKSNLLSLKKELKKSNTMENKLTYQLNSLTLDQNFELLDFYLYDYTTDYYRIVSRLRCKTKTYSDFVKLRYNFYKAKNFIRTDYTYIDYETYGYSGMLPYHISFLESYTNKVDFDSIAFEISYNIENGNGDIYWDQILELESNQIIIGPYSNEWRGTIKNKSNYSVTFPKIYACIFKNEKMIDLDYTYLDLNFQISKGVIIDSVTTYPSDSEQVTLKNESFYSVDISEWTIGDKNNPLAYKIPNGTILSPSEFKKFAHAQLGFQIDDLGEIIYLKDKTGFTVDIWQEEERIYDVRIYSVTTTPTEAEQVTLKNYSFINADISRWTIGDKNNPTAYRIPQGTVLSPGEQKTFGHSQLGFGINDKDEIIYLKNETGRDIDIWMDSGGSELLSKLEDRFYPNSIASFNSYIDLPRDYDMIRYYLSYSLYSLEGSGNITSNWPQITQLSYFGPARTNITFDAFLIDHENDRIQVQMDWGDGSALTWSSPFYSRSVASLTHSFVQPGIYYLTGKSKDRANSESTWSDSIKVEISPVPELSIVAKQLKSGIYQNSYEDTARAEGGIPPYVWKIVLGKFPNGLSLNPNNGKITGKPSASGNYSFSLEVIDGGIPSESDMASFTIVISNNPPNFVSANSITVLEHSQLSYSAQAVDPDGNTVLYQFKNYPSWLTPADATIKGIPPEGAKDTSFLIIASDGELSDTLLVAVTVIPVNDPPYFLSPKSVTAVEDSLLKYCAHAIDPEDSIITYSFRNYPSWMTVKDSTISGTPHEGAIDSSFVIIASDGELADTMQVDVTVMPINDPPQLVSANMDTAYEDIFFKYTAKAIDPEGSEIIYTFQNYPSWLTPRDSTISGTPREGAKKTSFFVIASDGELKDTLAVSITVIPVNDPPVIIKLSDFSFENTQIHIINLDSCVTDPDNLPQSMYWQITASDSNLKIGLETRVAKFTAPNWEGATNVLFKVADPEGATDSIVVKAVVKSPSLVYELEKDIPETFSLNQNYPNPFNPQTTIVFGLPKAAKVRIKIFNLKSQIVSELFSGEAKTGYHSLIWEASNLPSGVYFIRLESENFVQIKKCIFLK